MRYMVIVENDRVSFQKAISDAATRGWVLHSASVSGAAYGTTFMAIMENHVGEPDASDLRR